MDDKKDFGKWKNAVERNKLEGIQLFANNGFLSDFIKSYNIMSIPRFIFIDPQGNIISANAPRPSSENEIRKLFNTNIVETIH